MRSDHRPMFPQSCASVHWRTKKVTDSYTTLMLVVLLAHKVGFLLTMLHTLERGHIVADLLRTGGINCFATPLTMLEP